jgi:hypothetical protein
MRERKPLKNKFAYSSIREILREILTFLWAQSITPDEMCTEQPEMAPPEHLLLSALTTPTSSNRCATLCAVLRTPHHDVG